MGVQQTGPVQDFIGFVTAGGLTDFGDFIPAGGLAIGVGFIGVFMCFFLFHLIAFVYCIP
jgi:hypothetical protein